MISALDTHETVKSLTAAGFTDAHAEALAAAVKQAVDVDLSNIATKTHISDLRREMAEMKAELVKWASGSVSPKWRPFWRCSSSSPLATRAC